MNIITVIVPMFNEQDNIENCIDTLKKQKNQNFNVIFIDDGSSDSTVENLNKFLNQNVDFHYKVIRQANKGAAEARRVGIRYASTKFVMIFDCDDRLSDNVIDEVYKNSDKYMDVDIIIPNMWMQSKKAEWNELSFYTQDKILSPIDCLINSINGWKIHGCFAVRTSVINESYDRYRLYNQKNTNYINNDEIITRLNFLNSRSIVRSSAIYYYCYNPLSTTKKINKKKYLMIKNAVILSEIFSKHNILEEKSKQELIAVLWGTLIYTRKHKRELENIADWEEIMQDSIKEIRYFNIFNKLSLKAKIQLTILKLVNYF